jgi:hypothetical protein
MALINMTLQGKGGVGKSYVASLLAQYYSKNCVLPLCFDTDPVNKTFAGFTAFSVESVRLGENADEVNPRYFDPLLERIIQADADAAVVIDNGSATFLPLLNYMYENDAIRLMQESGHDVRIHSVLTGGQAMADTLKGLAATFDRFPTVQVVVWLNEYFGPVAKLFLSSRLYTDHEGQIHGLVHLPDVRRETFGHDIETMLKARQTFDEAVVSPEVNLMARQRLAMTWRTISDAMEKARL